LSNLLNNKDRAAAADKLKKKDGDLCTNCRRRPEDLNSPLEIDHVDEDRDNWAFENLQLLCKSCNVSKGNRNRRSSRTRRHGAAETLDTNQIGPSAHVSDPHTPSPPARLQLWR